MKVRAILSNRRLYLAWALVSALSLAVSAYVDPYVFGFVAFGAAIISGLLGLGAAMVSWHCLVWAAIGAIPTVLAFLLLSTYNWA